MRTSTAGPSTAAGPFTAPGPSTVAGPSIAASRAAPSDPAVARPSSTRAPAGNAEGQLIHQVQAAMTSATEDNDRDLFLAQRWRLNELTTYQGESNDAAIIRLAVQFLDRTGPRASARDAEIWLARGLGDLDNALDRWEAEADGADGQDHEDQPTNKKRRAEGSEARKFIPLTSVQAIVHQASTASQHAHLLLLANTEEDHQLHGPLFQ